VTLRVTHRTHGSDAYLLQDDEGCVWLYDRRARDVSKVPTPELLTSRGSWRAFDGEAKVIEQEAERLQP
jgi:hypothetical protein